MIVLCLGDLISIHKLYHVCLTIEINANDCILFA